MLDSSSYRYHGMNADYLYLLQKALNISVKIDLYESERQALNALEAGNADLVLTSLINNYNAVTPFIKSLPMVSAYTTLITTKKNVMYPLHTDSTVTIATADGYPSKEFVKTSFPNAEIVNYKSKFQALTSLYDGKIDYFIGNILDSNTNIIPDFEHELSIIKIWRSAPAHNQFITLNTQSILITIINKFLDGFTGPLINYTSQAWLENDNPLFMTKPLELTSQEQRWMEKHPKVKVLINPHYAQFTLLDENNEIRGVTGDILNLIYLQTGLEFQAVTAISNDEIVSKILKGGWDIIPTATYSPSREDLISFTHPIITTPFTIVVRTSSSNAKLLPGMKVAITPMHVLTEKLRAKHPDINLIQLETTRLGLDLLAEGKVDAVISTQLTSRYMIDNYYPNQLKYEIISDEEPALISFAVPHDGNELRQILNKALDNIQEKNILFISSKWFKKPDIKVDNWVLYNTHFHIVIAILFFIIFSFCFWSGYLSRKVRLRVKSQVSLENQIKFSKVLLNSIPIPIYSISLHGYVKSFNNAFISFFSTDPEMITLTSLYDSRNPLARIYSVINKDIKNGMIPDKIIEHSIMLNNGREERHIIHWITLCVMPSNNEMPTLICGWQDVTESRQLLSELKIQNDVAIQANEEKSIFLANMSHEIRTPVSTIMGFLELLTQHNQRPEEYEESILLASATAQSLLRLIGDILYMNRIESGYFKLSSDWINLEILISTVMREFEIFAKQKQLKLTFVNRLVKGEYLHLDAQVMKQLLSNLLSTAIKFTELGGIEVSAESISTCSDQTQLILRVTYTGSCISQEDQERLFKPYSHTQTDKRYIGSDIELLICRELIAHMNGKLSLQSQIGKGTTITIKLLTLVSHDDLIFSLDMQPSTCPEKKMKILIVDDHPVNRLLLRRQLDTLGYKVDEAGDGNSALILINENRYDLVITDVNMPNMDGVTLTQHIRSFDTDIIIWGLTANTFTQDKEKCIEIGMNECFFKPINLQKLTSELSSVES
ncbi:response regulator [Hafnia alvei]|uniref:response regulator n=1 Tax=Hafnia alvei TaxID=569 RepID=UPI0018B06A8B|nr:transporter substrate-binding domain-containing protein [Hafnia alvei]